MKSICFYFQVHQPCRLRTYRFFDIGEKHDYFDTYNNKAILKKVAEKNYLPMNTLLLDLIKEYGSAFKVSFSICFFSNVSNKLFISNPVLVLFYYINLFTYGTLSNFNLVNFSNDIFHCSFVENFCKKNINS